MMPCYQPPVPTASSAAPLLVLAPMQGLTELLFRKTYEECFPHLFDYAVSPFLSLTHNRPKEVLKNYVDVDVAANEGAMPLEPQLLGKEADEFAALANVLYETGYPLVNWNIGCPVRQVAAKHRGSGILPYPDEVAQFLAQVVPQLRGQLSVKMRLGYHSPTEIQALIPILNHFPLQSVCIHPRIGKQLYGGSVDLDALSGVLHRFVHRIIYSGDIFAPEDYDALRRRFPTIQEFMLGRGVLMRPTLPLEIRRLEQHEPPLPAAERRALSVRFIHRLIEAIETQITSEHARMRKLKEYWNLLSVSVVDEATMRRAALRQPDYASTLSVILSQMA
ncbi:MAG: tRNA-dihydrouridine synthase family protein [Bacteroidales bacterium]|nr:tRNA-dihydrouridine synthase family protein [Bacteroidales bacterium]